MAEPQDLLELRARQIGGTATATGGHRIWIPPGLHTPDLDRAHMAPPAQPVVSFDEIIKADRQRRKHEALASEIFGKGRRASAPGSGVGKRKVAALPTLASRVGITKRSVSATPKLKADLETGLPHDTRKVNHPQASRVSQLPTRSNAARVSRDNRLYAALQLDSVVSGANDQINILGASRGITIRGAAGPFVVMASNFAPGTTASDIQASLAPYGGEILSCRLTSAQPTVIAEIVFADKEGAETIIATFNNQKVRVRPKRSGTFRPANAAQADGRLLHLYLKQGPPFGRMPLAKPADAGARDDLITNAPREPGSRGRRRAEVELEDGRYGFGRSGNEGARDGRGLYSDGMVMDRGGFR
ncbi:MAG: hypothetical protein M1838_002040 [Thelocarpon superellum]|nr:MAG: hypothetical protein M1838_002040 [Thelocarpon superellum]